jgi:hypothetical protein
MAVPDGLRLFKREPLYVRRRALTFLNPLIDIRGLHRELKSSEP